MTPYQRCRLWIIREDANDRHAWVARILDLAPRRREVMPTNLVEMALEMERQNYVERQRVDYARRRKAMA